MSSPAAKSPYAGHRFPPEVISQAVWLYFRFPLSLRMVEEMLAARGLTVTHETVRQWALKFGQEFANRIWRRLPRAGDKWHLDEVAIKIAGVQHWLWRAVDQTGMVLMSWCRGGATSIGQAPAPQAAEAPMPGAACHGDRQAPELRSGKAGADPLRRAPPAQGPQ